MFLTIRVSELLIHPCQLSDSCTQTQCDLYHASVEQYSLFVGQARPLTGFKIFLLLLLLNSIITLLLNIVTFYIIKIPQFVAGGSSFEIRF